MVLRMKNFNNLGVHWKVRLLSRGVTKNQYRGGKIAYKGGGAWTVCWFKGGFGLHELHFDKKNPQEFIERVKEVINTQFRNEDRAVFGKGPYRLRKVFERYSVDDFQWGQLTAQQRLRKVGVFKKATMNLLRSMQAIETRFVVIS